ncbi:MAG TPA: helix-turn-helix domain-containing protein [Candidatus Saccharimonadales bacterium]|jgi:hypothetical protein|nr:helix-turn-helix domain-containing protein [Candidatus Saccharimonadales bacterium]
MTQIHTSRASDDPFIDRVWQTQNISDGTYLATPDGSWDLIMGVGRDGSRIILLTGQATEPAYIPYEGGTSSVVISFSAGAYLPHIAGKKLINSGEFLPIIDEHHFSLAGHIFALPTYENAEELVSTMVQAGILKNDDIVDGVLRGKPKAASERAVQRHFKATTGITHKKLQQIRKAQHAIKLLKQGKNPAEAAMDAGYSDQPHLAKSLKRIMHAKPSDIDDIHKL